jgi:hypothetical protein
MFQLCKALSYIPKLNFGSVTTTTNMFLDAKTIGKIEMTPPAVSFSVAYMNLSATALNEIYTNLPTAVGQTITVTGNYGVSGDDPSIAVGKGWTVTG